MTTAEIQQYVYDFFYNKGLPHDTICAIMGNITAESAWDVDAIENGNSIGFGLCQWSFGRRDQLEAYGTTLQHQCEFLWSELTGENLDETGADFQWIADPSDAVDNGAGWYCDIETFLNGEEGIAYLTIAFCYCWERPAYATNHLGDVRIPSAVEFQQVMEYNGTITPDDPEPETPTKKDKRKFNFIFYSSIKRRNNAVWKNRNSYRR